MANDRRLELHEILKNILGSENVYYQPPSNILMKYDAIRYSLNNIEGYHANNSIYLKDKSYTVMYITKNADSDIPDKIVDLPNCRMTSYYCVENLHHFKFILYY